MWRVKEIKEFVALSLTLVMKWENAAAF